MNRKEKEALLCSRYNKINRLLAMQNIKLPDREDLLHEIFIKAFRSLDQLREPDKIDSWLWKIARNETNWYLRGIITQRNQFLQMQMEEPEVYSKKTSVDRCFLAEDDLQRVCDRDELVQALRQLPEKTLVVFRLYYFEGYALNEIAQMTGERYNTVKSRHRRGLEKLREILKAERSGGIE